MREEGFDFVNRAVDGDKQALKALIMGVEDMIYNLTLRMLGTTQDAEDAKHELLL